MDIDKAVKRYTTNRSIYEALSDKVSEIIKEVLDDNNVEYYTITNRAKEVESFKEKAKNEKYNDYKDIKDLAGIRVITYVESEAIKVADIVKKLFNIDDAESVDKSKILGVDKVGYRSIHYIAKFLSDRCKLPEFKRFSDLDFEIQIRTILQHAWAEIEHDRNYKYGGILPEEIRRRFAILAGVLELADREFDQISSNINLYKNDVAEKTRTGELDIEINTTALMEFLTTKFDTAINIGLKPTFRNMDDEIIKELHDFGISTLKELNDIFPEDIEEKLVELNIKTSFAGLVRNTLIIKDENRYFEKAWNNHWRIMIIESQMLLQSYDIDIQKLAKKYNFIIQMSLRQN